MGLNHSLLRLEKLIICTVSIFFIDIARKIGYVYVAVTHYVEGTLMPLLVNRLIFTLIPQRTPFILRFFSSLICGMVLKQLIDPQLVDNFKLVGKSSFTPRPCYHPLILD